MTRTAKTNQPFNTKLSTFDNLSSFNLTKVVMIGSKVKNATFHFHPFSPSIPITNKTEVWSNVRRWYDIRLVSVQSCVPVYGCFGLSLI